MDHQPLEPNHYHHHFLGFAHVSSWRCTSGSQGHISRYRQFSIDICHARMDEQCKAYGEEDH